MLTIRHYNSDDILEWNKFVNASKNGTFMMKRDYIEYHSDRFHDFSLMFYQNNELTALLPASLHKNEVRSHGGLTYGGIISGMEMTSKRMLDVFDSLKNFLKSKLINKLIYKRIPSVYYLYPSDEDLYALYRNNGKLIKRDISTAIYLPEKIKFSELRKRGVKKAIKSGLEIRQSSDFKTYVALLTEMLSVKHNTIPVHTAAELELLALSFPKVIKLFAAYKDGKMLAGVLIFDTNNIVHTQYIANSEEGRHIGALDFVMDYLINIYSKDKKYFDFGISTEKNGLFLNEGLISQKEGFGGRAVVYDTYEVDINS